LRGSNVKTISRELSCAVDRRNFANGRSKTDRATDRISVVRAYRTAWKEAGHAREPRVSVSRSIFALIDDRDRAYFGRGREDDDQIGFIDERTRAISAAAMRPSRTYSSSSSGKTKAITEADTLLLTVPTNWAFPTTRM